MFIKVADFSVYIVRTKFSLLLVNKLIMRSIKRRFEYRKKNNPYWSTWTCFADSIMDQSFSKDSIKVHFNNLVDKNDYASDEKMQLLKYLYEITKPSMRSRQKWYKIRFKGK